MNERKTIYPLYWKGVYSITTDQKKAEGALKLNPWWFESDELRKDYARVYLPITSIGEFLQLIFLSECYDFRFNDLENAPAHQKEAYNILDNAVQNIAVKKAFDSPFPQKLPLDDLLACALKHPVFPKERVEHLIRLRQKLNDEPISQMEVENINSIAPALNATTYISFKHAKSIFFLNCKNSQVVEDEFIEHINQNPENATIKVDENFENWCFSIQEIIQWLVQRSCFPEGLEDAFIGRIRNAVTNLVEDDGFPQEDYCNLAALCEKVGKAHRQILFDAYNGAFGIYINVAPKDMHEGHCWPLPDVQKNISYIKRYKGYERIFPDFDHKFEDVSDLSIKGFLKAPRGKITVKKKGTLESYISCEVMPTQLEEKYGISRFFEPETDLEFAIEDLLFLPNEVTEYYSQVSKGAESSTPLDELQKKVKDALKNATPSEKLERATNAILDHLENLIITGANLNLDRKALPQGRAYFYKLLNAVNSEVFNGKEDTVMKNIKKTGQVSIEFCKNSSKAEKQKWIYILNHYGINATFSEK